MNLINYWWIQLVINEFFFFCNQFFIIKKIVIFTMINLINFLKKLMKHLVNLTYIDVLIRS